MSYEHTVVVDGKKACEDLKAAYPDVNWKEDPQHFSRLFKSRTGMTPNEYRLTA